MRITLTTIASVLRSLQGQCAPGEQPYLELADTDARLNRQEFSSCTDGGIPGLNQGQACECRFSLHDGPDGLHMHHYPDEGVLRFHVDGVDPLRDGPGHLAADTNAIAGAIIGGLLGYFATGSGKGALAGAAAGGFAGAHVPRGTARYFTFQSLRSGQMQLVGIEKGTASQHAYAYA